MKYAKYELVMKRCKVHESKIEYMITAPEDACSFATKIMKLHEKPQEVFAIAMLDCKGEIIGYSEISQGDLTQSIVHPREVYKPAIIQNAAAIIAFHNHPSGNPEPSDEDIAITKRLKEAGEIIGIKLFDHIIVGYNRYTSLAEQHLM